MRDSTIDRKLNNTFEIENVPTVEVQKVEVELAEREKDLQSDYEASRKNFYELVARGKEAIDGIMIVAQETDQPRAYEVAGQLIKTVTETNQQFMDLQKKVEDIKNMDKKLGNTNIENALFVGSTAELQKLLKDKRS
tara:strand:- start:155 stop:565 length:411 start_codon:yes stop_codon:yes gene_type:complete